MFRKNLAVGLILALGAGCRSDATTGALPYAPDKTTVIGGVDNPDGLAQDSVVNTPNGAACIDLDGICARPQDKCGDDGTADVLLDGTGAVVSVICYPTSGVTLEHVEGSLDHVGNDVVLALDGQNDGVDITGDVTIDGNNVTLYGQGPDTSVIGGNLDITKNNAAVRGVRVLGDVTIDKNNPSIVDCVIEGDLVIRGNNVSIALCEVWGKLTIEGNNTVLIGNRFAHPPEVSGKNTVCNGNLSFNDANADNVIGHDELSGAVTCSGEKTK